MCIQISQIWHVGQVQTASCAHCIILFSNVHRAGTVDCEAQAARQCRTAAQISKKTFEFDRVQ